MAFLEFEKPIAELIEQKEKLQQTAEKNKLDLSNTVRKWMKKL